MSTSGPGRPPATAHLEQRTSADRRSLILALALISGFMVVEVVVALLANSLVLLADAGHMLADAGALLGALWAIRLAARPVSQRWSYGLKRAEILSAALNGLTLVVVGAIVLVEAVQRLINPVAVAGVDLLAVAVLGVLVSGIATRILSRADRSSLNVEAAFQHILTDAGGFLATAAAAVLILATGFRQADSIASLVVVGLMAYAAWGLLRRSGRILLEGTPEDIDIEAVGARLLTAHVHVLGVHDVHAWLVTSNLPAISAHVVVEDSCFGDGHAAQILDDLQAALIGAFDVEHSTLQLEVPKHAAHEVGSH